MQNLFHFSRRFGLILALIFSFSVACPADDTSPANVSDPKSALDIAMENMHTASIKGPNTVPLGNQARLNLPEGYVYVPPKQAAEFMRQIGNHIDRDNFYGLVFHKKIEGFISIEYTDSGFINDDDAKEWDADELLENLKEGTKEGNKERVARGIEPIEIIGWVERPYYEQATHRLIWSAAIRNIGSTVEQKDQGVNYNTYLLGREGYLSLNLVTLRGTVEEEKPLARQLLGAVAFNKGKQYSDFNASTDRIAGFGLAALIGGVAAKKMGLLALIGVTLVKFWKLALIGFAAVGVGLKKFLFRSKAD